MQAAFCFSDDLKSTVVNPICFSNRLQPQNLPQPAPSPVGERAPRISTIFPKSLSLLKYKPCSFLALSHRERGL
ncbi:predicted protein [Neisseria gonorrhoeae SK-93-1035]|nr:predicted protein [Neisseria gonorrhoeae SK-93-1035]